MGDSVVLGYSVGMRHRLCPLTLPSANRVLLVFLMLVPLASVLALQEAPAVKTETKPAPPWRSLFDGTTLKNWKPSVFGGDGEITVKDGKIVLEKGSELTGIVWAGEKKDLPRINYELSLQAQRIEGHDFFCGLTFPVKDDPCSLIVGGWGGGVVGLSSLDGNDAVRNETVRYQEFEQGRWYTIRLRVSEKGILAWIDDKQVIGVSTKNRRLSIRSEVDASRPLGIASYDTVAGLKDLKVRLLTPEESTAPIPAPPLPKPK